MRREGRSESRRVGEEGRYLTQLDEKAIWERQVKEYGVKLGEAR